MPYVWLALHLLLNQMVYGMHGQQEDMGNRRTDDTPAPLVAALWLKKLLQQLSQPGTAA